MFRTFKIRQTKLPGVFRLALLEVLHHLELSTFLGMTKIKKEYLKLTLFQLTEELKLA